MIRRQYLTYIATFCSILISGCTGLINDGGDDQSAPESSNGPSPEGADIEEDDIRSEVEIAGYGDCPERVDVIGQKHEIEGDELVVDAVIKNTSDEDLTVPTGPVSIEVYFNAEGYNDESSRLGTTLAVGEEIEFTMRLTIITIDIPESYETIVETSCE